MEGDTKPLRVLSASDSDIELARQIVSEELGPDFRLEYHTMPKNTGITGDERVRGDTVIISADAINPTRFLSENEKLLDEVASKLWNKTSAITKVLFDITLVDEPPTKKNSGLEEGSFPKNETSHFWMAKVGQ